MPTPGNRPFRVERVTAHRGGAPSPGGGPTADPGLTLTAYTAEPGSASAEKLGLLAGWAVTTPQPDIAIDTA